MNLLRPKTFEDFIGNDNLKQCLDIQIKSAKIQKRALGHTLLQGRYGHGKTSLADIIAAQFSGNLHALNGASLTKKRHIFELACKIKENDVVFIDEIHRLDIALEEMMYPVMEDFTLVLPKSVEFHSEKRDAFTGIKIPRFTLIGATTDIGLLSGPFLSRFVNSYYLEPYTIKQLAKIIQINAQKLNLNITEDAIFEIAKRSRFVPRVANGRLEWIKDYSLANNIINITHKNVIDALNLRQIDEFGLEQNDRKYLSVLSVNKPMGLNTIVSMTQFTADTIVKYIEPLLIDLNRLEISPRGRLKVPTADEKAKFNQIARAIEDSNEDEEI